MIVIDGNSLTLDDIKKVSLQFEKVKLDEAQKTFIEKSRRVVDEIIENDKPVYGINTGFGYLQKIKISKEKTEELQYNLIRSHSAGVGSFIDNEYVRAMMLLRANTLAKGYSGVRSLLIEHILSFLNKKLHPLIPEKGSVGASGDLVPLAHLALALIGEGEVEVNGKVLNSYLAMKLNDIEPIKLKAKEGIALINGTQFISAVSSIVLIKAINIIKTADIALSMSLYALNGLLSPFDERIYYLRKHKFVDHVMINVRNIMSPYNRVNDGRVQDSYSLRCSPQVHGAVRTAFYHLKDILEIEINSTTDNPLVFPEEKEIVSNGNFHGEPIALPVDYFATSLTELGNISERRIAKLVDPDKNNGLPPFLSKDSGLNSGFMIPQFTAASLCAENISLSSPSKVNIPTSADQEDHVSMGATSAVRLKRIFENVRDIIAIELLVSAQAVELRGNDKPPIIGELLSLIREDIEFLENDKRFDIAIKNIAKKVETGYYLDNVNVKLY